MKKYFAPVAVLLITALVLPGCGALIPAPLPTPLPPEMIGTEIVQTAAALAAQTALYAPSPTATLIPSRTPRPSETPRPTRTPSITPSPTVTFVVHVPSFITPSATRPYLSPTPSRPSENYTPKPLPTAIPVYGATVYSQTPANGTVFAPDDDFIATWLFSNDTDRIWDQHEVDFVYYEGDKFSAPGDWVVDLPKNVGPNQTVTISVRFIPPLLPGTYRTTYLLHEGNRYYIKVSLTIVVVVPTP
ncbi:MAG: laminin G domain-containing protein [Anaerolineaceae bacterium]|nr:MAG: laminin G domain-containing protein [Anaerolineaceae bacterium]